MPVLIVAVSRGWVRVSRAIFRLDPDGNSLELQCAGDFVPDIPIDLRLPGFVDNPA